MFISDVSPMNVTLYIHQCHVADEYVVKFVSIDEYIRLTDEYMGSRGHAPRLTRDLYNHRLTDEYSIFTTAFFVCLPRREPPKQKEYTRMIHNSKTFKFTAIESKTISSITQDNCLTTQDNFKYKCLIVGAVEVVG
jgi:hypothetical protein